MSFTEKIKTEARKRSAYRCCACHKPFVEIHHIIPQSQGGPNTLENAAALCAYCHDLLGGNPDKRKQIREMRDDWWEIVNGWRLRGVEPVDLDEAIINKPAHGPYEKSDDELVAIYHYIYANESFETATKHLFELVQNAQHHSPDKKRRLYLDIEKRQDQIDDFDLDMFELQAHFVPGFLMKYLTDAYMPLCGMRNAE